MKSCVTLVNPRTDDDINIISKKLDNINKFLDDDGTLWIMVTDTDDLSGFPWKLAFELRSRGWYLRQDIISFVQQYELHHYFFLLSKSYNYFYNNDVIKEELSNPNRKNFQSGSRKNGINYDRNDNDLSQRSKNIVYKNRNKRSVWKIDANNLEEEFFELAKFAINAGSNEGDVIIDIFDNWKITQEVATSLGREFRRIE
jgi:site-specific DNA-methyltransferase (adenine-specific)